MRHHTLRQLASKTSRAALDHCVAGRDGDQSGDSHPDGLLTRGAI